MKNLVSHGGSNEPIHPLCYTMKSAGQLLDVYTWFFTRCLHFTELTSLASSEMQCVGLISKQRKNEQHVHLTSNLTWKPPVNSSFLDCDFLYPCACLSVCVYNSVCAMPASAWARQAVRRSVCCVFFYSGALQKQCSAAPF